MQGRPKKAVLEKRLVQTEAAMAKILGQLDSLSSAVPTSEYPKPNVKSKWLSLVTALVKVPQLHR